MLWKKILFLTLIKIIIISRPSTFIRVFLRRRPTCSTNDGIACVRACVCVCVCVFVCVFVCTCACVCVSFCKLKKETFPFYWISTPLKNWVPLSHVWSHSRKNSISNSFQTNFIKILHVASIFGYTIMTYLKSLMELSPLIRNSVHQDYLPELYPRYLLSYQKSSFLWCCFVAPARCGLSPLLLNLYRKPWRWRRIIPNSQKFSGFRHQKNSLNRFLSFAVKNVIHSLSNSNFHVIILCKFHL